MTTPLQRGRTRLAVMKALHLEASRTGRFITTHDIAQIADKAPKQVRTSCRDLRGAGLIDAVGKRPGRYRLNRKGQLWLGAVPARIPEEGTEE